MWGRLVALEVVQLVSSLSTHRPSGVDFIVLRMTMGKRARKCLTVSVSFNSGRRTCMGENTARDGKGVRGVESRGDSASDKSVH